MEVTNMNGKIESAYSWSAQGGVGVGGAVGADEHGGGTNPGTTMPEPGRKGQAGSSTPVVDEQSAREQATDATNNNTQTSISESAQ
jgi:hypothetical protein